MKLHSIRSIALAVALLVWGPSAAYAVTLAYVVPVNAGLQGTGDCSSPANACNTIGAGATYAGEGGVVFCLSPGYYSAPTITVGLTIDCPQGTVQSLTINAPGKNVRVRGLEINVLACGGGCTLVEIDAANSVTLDGVVVTGNSGTTASGILDKRNGPGKLIIRNSVINDNGGPGIVIAPQSGTLTVALDNVTAWNNTYGLAVGARGRVMINRSTFSGNSLAGVEADNGAFIGIDNSLVSSNNTGVLANPGSTIAISNTNINSNNTPISGATSSYGNNRLFANVFAGTAPTAAGAVSNETGQR